MLRLTPGEQRNLIPDDEVKAAFWEREDIRSLPPDKRESRWREHLVQLNRFRELLSEVDSVILP